MEARWGGRVLGDSFANSSPLPHRDRAGSERDWFWALEVGFVLRMLGFQAVGGNEWISCAGVVEVSLCCLRFYTILSLYASVVAWGSTYQWCFSPCCWVLIFVLWYMFM